MLPPPLPPVPIRAPPRKASSPTESSTIDWEVRSRGRLSHVIGRGLHSFTSQLNSSHSDTKAHPTHPVILPYTPSTTPEQPLDAPPR